MKIELKQVVSVRELQIDTSLGWKRAMGMLYFQQLEDGGMVPRVVTAATNGEWITKMINNGRIFIPEEKTVCEAS